MIKPDSKLDYSDPYVKAFLSDAIIERFREIFSEPTS
ncbi:hypothetical protein SDC9_20423 [bioreactor metagenome]|uniref:Uncharacterized protein n=1 Tax=bioreactor metagenome TaxID=1076179 RepID=A0A644U6P3_9ZZZZ